MAMFVNVAFLKNCSCFLYCDQGARAASRNLSSKLHKLDQESLKQQEIIYMQVKIATCTMIDRQNPLVKSKRYGVYMEMNTRGCSHT